jgi:hypothetical protein
VSAERGRAAAAETSGLVYGVRVHGRLPGGFAPFLRPLAGARVDPRRTLEVTYRTVAGFPEVEEIWAAEAREPATRDRFALFREPGGFGLAVASESRGLFRIGRRRIAVEWLPDGVGAPHFFYSYALPLWLESAGVTVLHASAVARGDVAVAFVGPSGAGKSTLCAELVRAGWEFVADDGLALEEDERGDWRCRLGPPWLRLWPSALAGRLGIAPEQLPRVRETLDKRRLPVAGGGGAGSAERLASGAREGARLSTAGPRLAAVYALDRRRSGEGEAHVAASSPAESLLALVEHSLAAAPLAALGLAGGRLDRLARAAGRIRVARLAFAAGGPPRAVADVIARDVAGELAGDAGGGVPPAAVP